MENRLKAFIDERQAVNVAGHLSRICPEWLSDSIKPDAMIDLVAAHYADHETLNFNHEDERRLIDLWQERAVIRLGNLVNCITDYREPTGKMLAVKGFSFAAMAELSIYCGAEKEHIQRLRDKASGAASESSAWFKARGIPSIEAGNIPGMLEMETGDNFPPMKPSIAAACAILINGGFRSEGFIVELCFEINEARASLGLANSTYSAATSRQHLRKEIEDAVQRGISAAKAYRHDAPVYLISSEYRPVVCPVCFHGFHAKKSLAMRHGYNSGYAVCPGCETSLELRAFNEDRIDVKGNDLRAYLFNIPQES